MITSLAGMNLTNGNGNKCDDLTKIKGIGLVKQQWLRESLNVYTFRDLANLSVDAIESVLKVEWQSVSRKDIKRWIVQARELAADELSLQQFVEFSNAEADAICTFPPGLSQSWEPAVEFVSVETQTLSELPPDLRQSGEPVVELVSVETQALSEFLPEPSQLCEPAVESICGATEENLLSCVVKDEWQSFASFKVEFQTRQTERQLEEQQVTVYYLEADQFQSWSSLESDRLQQWMLEQIQLSLSEGMQQLSEGGSSTGVTLVAVEIEEIRVFQPPFTEKPMVAREGNRLFSGTISSDQSFALEISFSLAGLNVAHITKKPIAYCAQFYVRDRVTSVMNHLGDTEPCLLNEGQLSYTAMLDEITLEPGVYRLQAIVKLEGISANPGSFKVPLLQVI